MEGLMAVTARLAEIRGSLATLSPPATGASATAFGAALQRASGGTAAVGAGNPPAAAGHAHSHATSKSGPLQPPPELARYGNGKIPATALQEIGRGNHRLYGPARQRQDSGDRSAGDRPR